MPARWKPWMVAGATGAGLMFLLDRGQGPARRRVLLRAVRTGARGGVRAGYGTVGRARGWAHQVRGWFGPPPPEPERDQFIKDRVQSALGHRRDLPLHRLSFDAADGVVHIRGTVTSGAEARDVVAAVAAVRGVRSAISRMRLPDGTPADGMGGDAHPYGDGPRAAAYAGAVRRALLSRWPELTDLDIMDSDGHPDRLATVIARRTGQPEAAVRPVLDSIIAAAV